MNQISQQVLHQRLRNRVIELFEFYSSTESIAAVGAFEALNMVGDWLPLDYGRAPKVFSPNERIAVSEFMKLVNAAADITTADTSNVQWFKNTLEWSRLSDCARKSKSIFAERGRFSEDTDEASLL